MAKSGSSLIAAEATRGTGPIDVQVAEILVKSDWVRNRYSPARLRACLEKWRRAVKARAREQGFALADEEIVQGFRVSYLRTLSRFRERKELRKQVSMAIDRLRKQQLLIKAGVDPDLPDSRARSWRQRDVEVIEDRMRIWECRLRAAVPGLADEDLYKYFRQRYLYVPKETFEKREIEKGIRNARKHTTKRAILKELCMDRTHPQYERWNQMEFWELKRKNDKLRRAIEACRGFSLGFPARGGVNAREYKKYLSAYPKEKHLSPWEEMLYKLVLHFEGMTLGQLQSIGRRHLSNEDWRSVQVDTCLNRLVDLRLLGVQDPDAGLERRYYVGRREYLKQAIEACKDGSLEFAQDVDQRELDDYLRGIREQGENGIGMQEKLLLKLISHYGLVSYVELNSVYDTYLSNNGGKTIWSKSKPRTYLTRLIEYELVELIGRGGRVLEGSDGKGTQDHVRYRVHRAFLGD